MRESHALTRQLEDVRSLETDAVTLYGSGPDPATMLHQCFDKPQGGLQQGIGGQAQSAGI